MSDLVAAWWANGDTEPEKPESERDKTLCHMYTELKMTQSAIASSLHMANGRVKTLLIKYGLVGKGITPPHVLQKQAERAALDKRIVAAKLANPQLASKEIARAEGVCLDIVYRALRGAAVTVEVPRCKACGYPLAHGRRRAISKSFGLCDDCVKLIVTGRMPCDEWITDSRYRYEIMDWLLYECDEVTAWRARSRRDALLASLAAMDINDVLDEALELADAA